MYDDGNDDDNNEADRQTMKEKRMKTTTTVFVRWRSQQFEHQAAAHVP
jgi:hypothetical protein